MKTSKMISSTQKPLMILFSALSLLAACKKDKDSNETPAAPLTYYTVKGTEDANYNDTYQLVNIDPATLTESVVYNLKDSGMNDIAFSSVTNEIVGLDDFGSALIKVNASTKQKTTVVLSTELNISYSDLVVDDKNNLYSVKQESTTNSSSYTLVKIDVATGKVTPLKPWRDVSNLIYLSSTNEILATTANSRGIAKFNLTSQDTSSVQLTDNTTIRYYDLFSDGKSNVYAYQTNINYTAANILQLDPATFASTVVVAPSDPRGLLDSKITYVPQRNEFVSIWKDLSFYRYDLAKKEATITALSTDPQVWYYGITTN